MGRTWYPVYDGIGRPVPEREHKPFLYRKRAADLCRRIEIAVDALAQSLEQSEYAQQADPDKLRVDLIRATDDVYRSIPFRQCPVEPHRPGCPVCGGKGWLSEKELDQQFTSAET